jgi:hypothetical protein
MRSWLSILLLVAACGTDVRPEDDGDDTSMIEPVPADACDTSYLTYDKAGRSSSTGVAAVTRARFRRASDRRRR